MLVIRLTISLHLSVLVSGIQHVWNQQLRHIYRRRPSRIHSKGAYSETGITTCSGSSHTAHTGTSHTAYTGTSHTTHTGTSHAAYTGTSYAAYTGTSSTCYTPCINTSDRTIEETIHTTCAISHSSPHSSSESQSYGDARICQPEQEVKSIKRICSSRIPTSNLLLSGIMTVSR